MECTLAALIACFSWSGLYLDTGLLYSDRGEHWVVQQSNSLVVVDPIRTQTTHTLTTQRIDYRKNPYGRVALGFEINLDSVQLRLEAAHQSSVATTKDRGVNSIGLNMRWYPFSR